MRFYRYVVFRDNDVSFENSYCFTVRLHVMQRRTRAAWESCMSVRPTVRLSNAYFFVTKLKKLVPTFYSTWKIIDPSILTRKMVAWWPVYPCQELVRGGRRLLHEYLAETDQPHFRNGDFQSIFARSASAVTQRKRSVDTNKKSTTSFPMSLRWTVNVAPKPKWGLENAKCPKFEQ